MRPERMLKIEREDKEKEGESIRPHTHAYFVFVYRAWISVGLNDLIGVENGLLTRGTYFNCVGRWEKGCKVEYNHPAHFPFSLVRLLSAHFFTSLVVACPLRANHKNKHTT